MAWLVRDDEVLASLEIADSARARARGLLGRDGIDGAIYRLPCRSVHTLGMRFAIYVAFVDEEMVVLRVVHMRPWRLARPSWRAKGVVEAEAGSFASWELRVGDQLEVRR